VLPRRGISTAWSTRARARPRHPRGVSPHPADRRSERVVLRDWPGGSAACSTSSSRARFGADAHPSSAARRHARFSSKRANAAHAFTRCPGQRLQFGGRGQEGEIRQTAISIPWGVRAALPVRAVLLNAVVFGGMRESPGAVSSEMQIIEGLQKFNPALPDLYLNIEIALGAGGGGERHRYRPQSIALGLRCILGACTGDLGDSGRG
jgi:hypothetical protein